MFTGIVEAIGTIKEYKPFDDTKSGGQGVSVTIENASKVLRDCHIGDSIAVDGVCLTVTEFDEDSFKVGISPETLRRTTVGSWRAGGKVNLERAVAQETRFGGHYVQGHVDTVAKIVSREKDANSIIFGFQLRDPEYNKFIVEKGFICIDGTSLTVTRVVADDKGSGSNVSTFYIAMIKHTQESVTMPLKSIGDEVNIEVDITGKLIEKQITAALESQIQNEGSPLHRVLEKLIDEKLKQLR